MYSCTCIYIYTYVNVSMHLHTCFFSRQRSCWGSGVSRIGVGSIRPGCCEGAVSVLFGCCLGAVWVLFGCCLGAAWCCFVLLRCCRVLFRVPHPPSGVVAGITVFTITHVGLPMCQQVHATATGSETVKPRASSGAEAPAQGPNVPQHYPSLRVESTKM